MIFDSQNIHKVLDEIGYLYGFGGEILIYGESINYYVGHLKN